MQDRCLPLDPAAAAASEPPYPLRVSAASPPQPAFVFDTQSPLARCRHFEYQMEDCSGKCSAKAGSKDQMEEGASVGFDKASSQGKVGGRRHNDKATRQSPMGEGPLDKEQSEDIEWLSSLSHSHLDMLISLKELAILRAKNAGYEEAAEKFDLRMLRSFGTILMGYLKDRIQNASIFPDSSEGFELLSGSQFGAQKHEKDSCQVTLAENITSSSCPTRKRLLQGNRTGLQSRKKPKIEDSA